MKLHCDMTAEQMLDYIQKEPISPWSHCFNPNDATIRAAYPINPITGTRYSGNNRARLYLELFNEQNSELRFATRKQIEKIGGTIKDNAKEYYIYNRQKYTVYNYEDVILPNKQKLFSDYKFTRSKIDKLLKQLNVKIKTGNVFPSYVPAENTIYIPGETIGRKEKYEVLIHEIAHWTKYNLPDCDRTCAYCMEEITAELAMWKVCERFFKISKRRKLAIIDYIRSWISDCPYLMRRDALHSAIVMANTICKNLMSLIEEK